MAVPVMQIRIVGVFVPDRLMPMPVRMRLRYGSIVPVLVVLVVNVAMFMLQDVVLMLVLMPLGKMQPKTKAHQQSRQQQLKRQRLVQQRERDHGADERSQGKVSARTRRP